MDKNFDFKKVEEKWRTKWEEEGVYHFDEKSEKPIFSSAAFKKNLSSSPASFARKSNTPAEPKAHNKVSFWF